MGWQNAAVLAFGIPGPRTVAVVAVVVLALYGRSGTRLLMMTRYGRSLQPWLRLAGIGTPAAARRRAARDAAPTAVAPRRHGWVFWALALTAAAAVAALIATRLVVLSGSGTP